MQHLQQITQICHTSKQISSQQLCYISQITYRNLHEPTLQLNRLCMELWKQLENSQCFWGNMHMFLTYPTATAHSKIQALLLIEKRVRNIWFWVEPAVKDLVRNQMIEEVNKYTGQCDQISRIYFTKVCNVVSVIFLYEHNTTMSTLLGQVCQQIICCQFPISYLTLLHSILQQCIPQSSPQSQQLQVNNSTAASRSTNRWLQKLTSQQCQELQSKILSQYNNVHKFLEKYIHLETNVQVLRLCFHILSQLVAVLPIQYLVVGQLIQKIMAIATISSSQNTSDIDWSMQSQAIQCLLTISKKETNECEQASLPKYHKKKLQILLKLLQLSLHDTEKQKPEQQDHIQQQGLVQNKHPHKNGVGFPILQDILECALQVVTMHQRDAARYQGYLDKNGFQGNGNQHSMLMSDPQSKQLYQSVLHLLSKLLLKCHKVHTCSQMEDAYCLDYSLNIYQLISSFLSKEQGIDRILNNMIELVVCPYDSLFYQEIGIHFDNTITNQKYTNSNIEKQIRGLRLADRDRFSKIVSNVVNSQYEAYEIALLNLIDQNYFKLNTNINYDGKYLAKLVFNIYYFIDVSTHSSLKITIFTIISRLLKLQQTLHSQIQAISGQKRSPNNMPNSVPKISPVTLLHLSTLLKPLMLLLLSHPKCLQSFKETFYKPFIASLYTVLKSGKSILISAVLDILHTSYSFLEDKDKAMLHSGILANRAIQNNKKDQSLYTNVLTRNRKYVRIVSRCQPFPKQVQYVLDVLNQYKQQILVQKSHKVDPNNRLQIQHHSQTLYQLSLSYSSILLQILPNLGVVCLSTLQEYPSIFPTITPLSLSLSKAYLQNVPTQLSIQEVNALLTHALPIAMLVIDNLGAGNANGNGTGIHDDVRLDYAAVLLNKLIDWQIDQLKKVSIVDNIVNTVYAKCNGSQVDGWYSFMRAVIKCLRYLKLSASVFTKSLLHITSKLASTSTQSQQSTTHTLDLLHSLLHPTPLPQLHPYILDLLSNTFHQFLLNSNPLHIPQYTAILDLMIEFIDKINGTAFVVPLRKEAVGKLLITVVNKIYKNFPYSNLTHQNAIQGQAEEEANSYGQFRVKIEKFLGFVIEVKDQGQFDNKMRDLLIVLRRGY